MSGKTDKHSVRGELATAYEKVIAERKEKWLKEEMQKGDSFIAEVNHLLKRKKKGKTKGENASELLVASRRLEINLCYAITCLPMKRDIVRMCDAIVDERVAILAPVRNKSDANPK